MPVNGKAHMQEGAEHDSAERVTSLYVRVLGCGLLLQASPECSRKSDFFCCNN